MSAKGKRVAAPRWTEEKRAEAAKSKHYIKAAGTGGPLKLTGAAQKWKKDPTFLYVPSLRVAGSRGDILALFPDRDVSADLAAAFSAASAAGALKAAYDAEVAAVKAASKRASSPKPALVEGRSISDYAAMVDAASKVKSPKAAKKSPKKKAAKKSPKKKAAKKSKSPKKAAKKSKSPKKAAKKSKSPKKSASPKRKAAPKTEDAKAALTAKFQKRLDSLSEGKLMDVSDLKVDAHLPLLHPIIFYTFHSYLLLYYIQIHFVLTIHKSLDTLISILLLAYPLHLLLVC